MITAIQFDVERPPDATIRTWRRVTRDSHEAMGRYWHEQFLPEHFRPYARFRYGYQRRAQKTQERKRKLAAAGKVQEGGTVDLVHSGLMRELLTNNAVFRGFPTRVTISMVGPRYVTFRPRAGSNQPNKMAEVLRVIPAEANALRRKLMARIASGLENSPRTRRRTTIR